MSSKRDSITNNCNAVSLKLEGNTNCYEILDNNVTIILNPNKQDHGSSKVKLKNIVDYKWEVKNYYGHLIAAHQDGKTIAYTIKVSNKLPGVEGMVRVADVSSGKRTLIKGMSGEVLDLQFAFIKKVRLLGCIDENSLHIHKIDTLSDNLVSNLILKIEDPLLCTSATAGIKYDKISWCPYIPGEYSDDEDDLSQLLVWSRGGTFQCFNVSTIINVYGIGKHKVEHIIEGHLKFTDSSTITWVSLSPDGTTLGVGTADGYIKFYQVYFHEEQEPRRLHQWNPHGGKAISSFFFLDNLSSPSTDTYWKYALTGAKQNTEFKVWDCGTWECLQVINLTAPDNENISFIADVDRTSSYLLISNVDLKKIYVLQIACGENLNKSQENGLYITRSEGEDSATKKEKKSSAFIKSISEFPLSSPILSFWILDAAVRKYKCESENYLIEEMEDYDEDNNVLYCVVVRLYIVQPKSVQECHILYQPTIDESCEVKSSISNESVSSYRSLTKMLNSSGSEEKNIEEGTKGKSSNGKRGMYSMEKESTSPRTVSESCKSYPQVNLMTPEAFRITGNKSPENISSEVLSTIRMLANVKNASAVNNTNSENTNLLDLVSHKSIEMQENKSQQQSDIVNSNSQFISSGGSSPSREVQEIMGLQDIKMPFKEDKIQNDMIVSDPLNLHAGDKGKVGNVTMSNDGSSLQPHGENKWPKVPNDKSPLKYQMNEESSCNAMASDISQLNLKLNTLIGIIKQQSVELREVKGIVVDMQKEKSSNVKEEMYGSGKQTIHQLEEYFQRFEKDCDMKLEKFTSSRDAQNAQFREELTQTLNQFLCNQFSDVLIKAIMPEFKQIVIQVVASNFDLIEKRIQTEISSRLSTIDKNLKENIVQVCKSKSLLDAFGKSVLGGVQTGLQTIYVESMTNTLIPAYEKSSQEMFKQLHDTFSRGIKNVMEQFDNYLTELQPVHDSTDEILEKFEEFRRLLDPDILKQKIGVLDAMMEMKKDFKLMEANLMRNFTHLIQSEVKRNFESQAASLEDSVLSVVRSRTQTPAPSTYDVQEQIRHLLNQGQTNKAFHQALLANDLSLVDFTLEKAEYKQVFNPCVLEQTVLLSLIQQISVDMNNHNETRQQYLADGLINLNHNDPITKEHAPKVMSELYRNCQRYVKMNVNSPLCTGIRMILMAVHGMGYNFQ